MFGDILVLFVLLWLIWLTGRLAVFALQSMLFPNLTSASGITYSVVRAIVGNDILLPVAAGALAIEIIAAVFVARRIF